MYFIRPPSHLQLGTRVVWPSKLSQKQPSRGTLKKKKSKILKILKLCREFTSEHPCQSVISIKLQSKRFLAQFTKPWLSLIISWCAFISSSKMLCPIPWKTIASFTLSLIGLNAKCKEHCRFSKPEHGFAT